MADEAREIRPYTTVSPDRETPVKDFRPVYENSTEDDEPHGGLTVEEVNDGEAGDEAPKGSTAMASVASSSEKVTSPKVPVPDPGASPANADSAASKSKPGKDSQQTSSPDQKSG